MPKIGPRHCRAFEKHMPDNHEALHLHGDKFLALWWQQQQQQQC